MRVPKRILVPDRVRVPPTDGWSWIDRRFLREHSSSLQRDSILLYFFLAAVSDKNGISFYSDTAIGGRLRVEEASVSRARDELQSRDLIAYEPPLYQVLSAPERARGRVAGEPTAIGEILRRLAEKPVLKTPGRRHPSSK